jgi:hypothetical protein
MAEQQNRDYQNGITYLKKCALERLILTPDE